MRYSRFSGEIIQSKPVRAGLSHRRSGAVPGDVPGVGVESDSTGFDSTPEVDRVLGRKALWAAEDHGDIADDANRLLNEIAEVLAERALMIEDFRKTLSD